MPPRRAAWSLLLLGLAGGCPDGCPSDHTYYLSESRTWRLTADELVADPCDRPGSLGLQQDEPMLVGTRWCPAIDCVDSAKCPSNAVHECYDSSIAGPGVLDDGCVELTGTGELVLRFDPIPCDIEGLFFPEQLRIRSVAQTEVQGRLVSYLDTMALGYLHSGTGSFPLELTQPRDATLLKLAADEPVHMAVNLWAGERHVAWSGDQATLEVEVLRGGAPIATLDEGAATVLLQAPAGSEAALTLVVGTNRIALGRIRGVALDTLTELDVVVAYANYPEENSPGQLPLAARAVARDGEGDLVYGAQPEWEVLAGSFAFAPMWFYTDDANHDYTLFINPDADGESETPWCFPTPTGGSRSYTARVAAHVGDLQAEVDLAWTYVVSPDEVNILKPLHPGPNCEGPGFDEPGACTCASDPQSGPALAFLALLALGTARRRRRLLPH